jgi:hypothetical protein
VKAPDGLRISRRGFLGGAGAGALLAVARLPVAAAAAAPPEAPPLFSDAEREVLTAVVERMVDPGEPGLPAVRDTDAVAVIERVCAGLDPSVSRVLPWLLRAVEWGPLFFDWTFARFTGLDEAGRDAALRGWMTSRLEMRRLGFQALRNLSFVGWYSQDAVWPAIGYAGPLLEGGAMAPR